MKKQLATRDELKALNTLLVIEEETTATLASDLISQITDEEFAKYSHGMLLSLQRLALYKQQDELAHLLGIAMAEADRLMMKVRVVA